MEPTFIRPLKLHLGDILTTFPEHGPVDILPVVWMKIEDLHLAVFHSPNRRANRKLYEPKMQESFYRQLDQYLTRFLPICEKQPN